MSLLENKGGAANGPLDSKGTVKKESQNHANRRKLSIQLGVCFGLKLGDVSLSYYSPTPWSEISGHANAPVCSGRSAVE